MPSTRRNGGRLYVRQVDALMASLKDAGAAVYWVEMPPMQAEKYDDSMKIIAAIHKERAAAAGIRFVETRTALTENGKYAESGFDDTGEFVRLRSRDGVHFLKEGNNKLAGLVMAAINKDIEAAVAAAPPAPPPAATTESQPMPGFGQSPPAWRNLPRTRADRTSRHRRSRTMPGPFLRQAIRPWHSWRARPCPARTPRACSAAARRSPRGAAGSTISRRRSSWSARAIALSSADRVEARVASA